MNTENKTLKDELIGMADEDQGILAALVESGYLGTVEYSVSRLNKVQLYQKNRTAK